MAHDHHHHDHVGHGHDHAHGHDHSHGADQKRVAWAALVTILFMFAEVIGGILSGSLALLADAAHMLTDAGALVLAWLGFRLAERPADAARTYGFARFRILAAFTNGVALIALAAWIAFEATTRLFEPVEIQATLMISVAIAGLIANLIAFAILHGGSKDNLNMQGALWHVAGDLLGSIAAIIAGVVIVTTGWTLADPILSVLIAALVAFAGWRIARQSAHILLEGAPPGLSPKTIAADLEENVPGAVRVHHVHAWSLTETRHLVTLQVVASQGCDRDQLRHAIRSRLNEAFGVDHATVEVESASDADTGEPVDCTAT